MGNECGLFPAVQQSALRMGSSSPPLCEFCGHESDSQWQKLCKLVHPLTKFLGQCIKAKEFGGGGRGEIDFFYLILYCPEADPFLVNTRNPKASAHHMNWTGVPQLWPAHQGERKAGGNDDTIDLLWAKRGRVTMHPSVPYLNVQAPEDCSRLHPRCPATAKTLVAEPRTFSGLWQTWWGEVVVVVVTGGVIWHLVSWV